MIISTNYRIKPVGTSERFGSCEVCGSPGNIALLRTWGIYRSLSSGDLGTTEHKFPQVFGHEACLKEYLKSIPNFLELYGKNLLQKIYCKYAETCYPDFLTDHHSREGETLLCYEVHPDMTVDSLREGLWEELNRSDWGLPESISDDDIRWAIEECLSGITQEDIDNMLMYVEFDEFDEESEEGSGVFAYHYLDWKNAIALSTSYQISNAEVEDSELDPDTETIVKTGAEIVQWAVELGYQNIPNSMEEVFDFLANTHEIDIKKNFLDHGFQISVNQTSLI